MTMEHRFTVHFSPTKQRTLSEILKKQKKKFMKRKRNGCESETNVQTSKNGGAGGALLERNTGSWHSRGRELSYGTEAQVWGTGKILIYKIDVWQNFDFHIDASESSCDLE